MRTAFFVLSFTVFFTAVFSNPLAKYEVNHKVSQEPNWFEKRDLTTIWSVLSLLTDDLTKMNKTLEAFDGTALLAVPILDAASVTLKDLNTGFDKINATEELNLITSIGVLSPVYYLHEAVLGVTSQLVAKKDLFEKADVLFVVADELAQFQVIAGKLVTATVGKIPWYLGIISQPIGNSIKVLLDDAAKAYGVVPPA
jgi:hypothetical protein